MNKIFKSVIATLMASSIAISSAPVFAKDKATLYATTEENINMNNHHVLKTVYTIGDQAVYSLTENSVGTLKSTTQITNYTAQRCNFTATIYAVDANGGETAMASAENSVTTGASGTVEVSAELAEIPTGTVSVITKVLSDADNKEYETTKIDYTSLDVFVPEKAPADTWWTTFGVHDPSIVKFPNDDTYYVYSSHHLIFTSTDLINWTKHEQFVNTNLKEISPKTYDFIAKNINENVNGTYWAPDVIYMPDDTDTPYWMYISVSCGLGGCNSAISLMKSPTPLFWADTDSEKVAAIEDAGVVFMTLDSAGYKTNAIDANIYTDANGMKYFLWGSFWGGIQGAKLTSEGFVEGIDYTSDETLISSCANFGKTLVSQKDGIAGPEGAWTIEHGDYRYMFTSYGWLGSNYNTRVARSPLSIDFAEVLADPTGEDNSFVDQNGVAMGSEFTLGSYNATTGYKMIGSYRLGSGRSNEIKFKDNNYYVEHNDGDAPSYYGPGHNSVIKADDGEYYYVSHTRKNGVEGAAWLQVRKMLWTESGWPVVSPVTYSGEKEQTLPVSMISGTYDIVPIGYTKMMDESILARNFDVPMLSTEIELLANGTIADGVGTWSFDGENTVTISFAKDGDNSKREYYKSGDTLEAKAILSYNKDTDDYVMALIGADNSDTAYFATKPMSEKVYTEPVPVVAEETVIEKSNGGNPILGFNADGSLAYGGDPAATVVGDTIYLYVGHDEAENEEYVMTEYLCYSSKDMKNWTCHGSVMKASDVSWRNVENAAWASQMIPYGGKYYLYFCTWDKTADGKQSIGVAVADSPTGPFKDIGASLVKGTVTEPETSGWNDIDPTVWVENDENGTEHRYLAWGNGIYYICELNEDMVSIKDINGDGEIKMGDDIFQQTFVGMGGNGFTEAPWLYRRQNENGEYYGQYYTFFAANWREEMAYAVTDDISSNTWTYKGVLMPPTATSNTNHPSVIDFNGKTYFIYHNGALPKGSGFRRSVCVQEMSFDENGNIYPIEELSTGVGGTAVTIRTKNGTYFAHDSFTNPLGDEKYPIVKNVYTTNTWDDMNTSWEITNGLYQPENESYVSIQAVNKPGLYVTIKNGEAVITQNADGNQSQAMTFKTVKALDGSDDGVSFESLTEPGKFLSVYENKIMLTYGTVPAHSVFVIGGNAQVSNVTAQNEKISFTLENADMYDKLTAYVAEYENGKLVGVGIEKLAIEENRQTVEIPYAKKSENSSLKLFVWDGVIPVALAKAKLNKITDGCTAYFNFDGNLTNSITGETAVITGNRSNAAAAVNEAQYVNHCDNCEDNKAVALSGENSYGLNLGKLVTCDEYTIMFDMKVNEFTVFTPTIFLDVDGGSKWVSAPIGWQSDGTTMVWSSEGSEWISCVSGQKSEVDTWYNVTLSAKDGVIKIYVDGNFVGDGKIADVINSNTTMYLGVNYWDTPFNGNIDNLCIFNGTALAENEITQAYNELVHTH